MRTLSRRARVPEEGSRYRKDDGRQRGPSQLPTTSEGGGEE
jgi:hypothetical protein